MPDTAAAQLRITQLATQIAVHRAFHWLHLHEPQLRQWQLAMLRIPSPPFKESARAAWFLDCFRQLGLTNTHLDAEGNVLAEISPASPAPERPGILISAHLDTVFPAGTSTEPTEDGACIFCPGACDNGAGLTALLGIAAALRYANIQPPVPIFFTANVGEEGEGDLRGIRHIFLNSVYKDRIAASLVLEGSGNAAVVTRSLGSRRYRITVTGPGGHAWADAGVPNPAVFLSRALVALSDLDLPGTPRTILNIGQISGGTSINSIPESATALLDLRSTEASCIEAVEHRIHQIVALIPGKMTLEVIGDRPSAELPEHSPILTTLHAVDRHLNLKTQLHIASTDANIPMSLNIPALAIGAGGQGGGIHTLHEWYDPTGREIALRRILLTLLDLACRSD